jgi:hypothetical protein
LHDAGTKHHALIDPYLAALCRQAAARIESDAALLAASRERERLYAELMYAVASKFPGETRHETALRYIRNAERGSDQCAKAATTPDSAASPTGGEG